MVGPLHLHGCPNHTAEPGLPPCLMPPLPHCCLACITCVHSTRQRSAMQKSQQQPHAVATAAATAAGAMATAEAVATATAHALATATAAGAWGDSSGGGAQLRQMGLSSAWRWWRQVRPMDGASQHQYHFCHNLMHVTVVGASQPMGPQPWGSCTCDACCWAMRGPQMHVWVPLHKATSWLCHAARRPICPLHHGGLWVGWQST